MLLSAASISLEYPYDNTITFNGGKAYTFDNLDVCTNSLLRNVRDVTINRDQLLILTDNIDLSTIANLALSAADEESYIARTLITNNAGSYLYTTDSFPWTGTNLSFTTDVTSATVFGLNFRRSGTGVGAVSANTVQIFTEVTDTLGTVYTLYLINNGISGLLSAGPVTLYEQDYTFCYNLSGDAFSLFSYAPGVYSSMVVYNTSTNALGYSTLSPAAPNSIVFPTNGIFRVVRGRNENIDFTIEDYGASSLIKYDTVGNSVSIANDSGPVLFNHLISTAYKTLTANTVIGTIIPFNINTLKNYYSPQHSQSVDLSTQLRSYSKIYTGLNQEEGYDKIYLGYNASTVDRVFKRDETTWFHFPYGTNITPLTSTSESLISYGAYGDITPYRSDRVVKKLGSYKRYTNWGDSSGTLYTPATGGLPASVQNGTYFCTWLSAGSNTSTPVWMDRFYDARKLGGSVSLSLSGVLVASNNNYPTLIWDVPSQLTFEPGVLYSYHRIGVGDTLTFVNSISGLTYHIVDWSNPIINNVTGLSAGVINNFTAANSAADIEKFSKPYYIVDSTFGSLFTNEDAFAGNAGNTLSFFAYNEDWTNVQGTQLVGNYFNGGIGLFNTVPLFTPYFTVCTNTGYIKTYNCELQLINYDTINTLNTTTLSSHNFIVRSTYDSNYYILDSFTNNDFLGAYDPDDLLTQRTPLTSFVPAISAETITNASYFIDSSTNNEYIIVQTRQSLSGCTYRKFTPTGILVSSQTSTANNFVVDTNGNPIFYNSTYVLDGNSIVNTVSGCNGVVDSKGHVFALSGSALLKGTTTDSLTGYSSVTGAPSAALLNIANAEYINCDQDDNLWVTYNFKYLAKVDTNGNVLWTKQINLLDPIVYNQGPRVINFIAEPTTAGIQYYGLILDGKSECIYKVDMNGNVINHINVPGIIVGGDHTGFNGQRMYVKPNAVVPSLKVKLVTKDSTVTNPAPTYVTLTYGTSALSPGWHHFAITYDNTDITTFYVDGVQVGQSPALGGYGTVPHILHTIYNYKNNPNISLGAANFKTNTLNDWIELSTSYLFNGRIADVRFYNTTLNWSDIRAISKSFEYGKFTDLRWISPTGTRSYIEEIERFFLHRLPGAKSQYYNIRIKNSGITDPNVQKIVEDNINNAVNNIAPAYTKLRSIIWE